MPHVWRNLVMIPPRPRRMIQAKAAMKVGSIRGRVLRVMIRGFPITFQRDTIYPMGTPTMIAPRAEIRPMRIEFQRLLQYEA